MDLIAELKKAKGQASLKKVKHWNSFTDFFKERAECYHKFPLTRLNELRRLTPDQSNQTTPVTVKKTKRTSGLALRAMGPILQIVNPVSVSQM